MGTIFLVILYIIYSTCNFVLITRKEGGAVILKLLPELFVYIMWATPRFTAAVKIPLPGNISVLEFFSVESSLKAISSDYGSNKEY